MVLHACPAVSRTEFARYKDGGWKPVAWPFSTVPSRANLMSQLKDSNPGINNNPDAPHTDHSLKKPPAVEWDVSMASEGERPLGISKEHSGWDVYNNEAKKVDTELVNDWRGSLNSLLLFVSIFETDIYPPNSVHAGGHFCRRSHSFYHRE
jgi:hypothetical protein